MAVKLRVFLSGVFTAVIVSCGTPKFSGTSKPSTLKPTNENAVASSSKQNPNTEVANNSGPDQVNLDPISDEDTNLLCRTMFDLPAGSKCKIPTSLLFGGSYQIGKDNALSLPNIYSKKTECGANYVAESLGVTNTFSGGITMFMCWASNRSLNAKSDSSEGCPKNQAHMMQNGSKLCSDIPVRTCKLFEGNYDFATGKCILLPFKTVFGGVFESGEFNVGYPKVSIFDPDGNMKIREEHCETPNTLGGFPKSCECPAGFAAFSSSGINENQVGSYDRYNYCFRETSAALKLGASLEPEAGCSNQGELKQTLNGKQVCTSSASRLCATVGGVFNSLNSKCILPQEEFFGGAYQVGESKTDRTLALKVVQDPSENRLQYCEAPNPFVKKSKDSAESVGCLCPTGFKAHNFIAADENAERTEFDREYLCIIDR